MDNQERNREALVDHIAEQDRILRRRNEQIARQAKQIENQSRNAEEDQRAIEAIEAERDEYRAMHSEQIKTIARLQKNPRPLTADDITDEMVVRGAEAIRGIVADSLPVHGSHISRARTATKVLLAALTSPPSRPEGAEELAEVLDRMDPTAIGGPLTAQEVIALADHLASRGVRATGKDN